MRKFLQNLMGGKFAIGYTLTTIGNMVPREIRWVNKLPILSEVFTAFQLFWFIIKVWFFVLVISWFKPQYNNAGAKIFLFLITFGLFFFAWWMTKRERYKQEALK